MDVIQFSYAVIGIGATGSCLIALRILRRDQIPNRNLAYLALQAAVILGLGVLGFRLGYMSDHREPVRIMAISSLIYVALILFLPRARCMDLIRARLSLDAVSLLAIGYHLLGSSDPEDSLVWYCRAPIEIPLYGIILLSRSSIPTAPREV